jgi:hypothetical protein
MPAALTCAGSSASGSVYATARRVSPATPSGWRPSAVGQERSAGLAASDGPVNPESRSQSKVSTTVDPTCSVRLRLLAIFPRNRGGWHGLRSRWVAHGRVFWCQT